MNRLCLAAVLLLSAPTASSAWQRQDQTAIATATSSSRSNAIGAIGTQSLRNSFRPTNVNTINVADPPANSGFGSGVGNNVGNTNVHIPYQAPSVYAPSGTSSNCTDTWSFGASGPGAGLAFGFPGRNGDCNRRADAVLLSGLGLKAAARQRMCFDDDAAQAMEAVGFQCRVGKYAVHK
jgi:hypothetical protein